MKDSSRWRFIGALVAAGFLLVGLLVLTIIVTGNQSSTKLENGLLQFISFMFSVAIAGGIGYFSAKEQGKAIVRPHGRKAVRRIVTLGDGVRSFGTVIEAERERFSHRGATNGQIELFEVERTFDVLYSQLEGQLRTINDAIEDWRDVVPEDVAAIEQRAKGGESG